MLENTLRQSLYLVAASLALALLGASGCDSTASAPRDPSAPFAGEYPIKVVCTTGPVADLLRHLGGPHVHVTGLMGPGVDPHQHKVVPSEVEQLGAADLIFYNGLHLEGRMADLLEGLAERRPTYAVTNRLVEAKDKRLRTPPEFEGLHDPHVWHDPRLWSECANYVAEVLMKFDPQHRDDYAGNRDDYLKQLDEADQYARGQLGAIPTAQRSLVTAHDAFGYFCAAYDMKSMPLKGVSTEEEVSIGRMDEVIEFLVQNKIKAVFVESATTPQIVKALIEPCQRQGHEVRIGGELYADALGSADSGADTYIGMFKANVDTIVEALK